MQGRGIFVGRIAVLLCLGVIGTPLRMGPAYAQQLIGPAPSPAPPGALEVIPGQFIVELRPEVERDVFIDKHRLAALHRYTLINGFAARMSQAVADRLAADAQVQAVHPDLVVHAFANGFGRPGGGGGSGGGDSACPDPSSAKSVPQVVPTGVSRIGASSAWATRTGAGVKVAVIDTGIDLCHPDLQVKGGVNLLAKKPPTDDHGHGTHVAGIIGALNNGFGVVGVAPGAALYAVKVLDKTGSGSLSTAIKGLDWAVKNKMQVANLSLGAFDFSLGSGPICTAVANAVAAGVTVVVAAGNAAFEALYFTPANCPESFTVSALADTDGLPGGGGDSVSFSGLMEADDTFAESFSNYGNYCWDRDGDRACTDADTFVVSLMAPGVEILSTLPTSPVTLNDPTGADKQLNYDTLTGTSMAAPHVAGAAALYIETKLKLGATPTPAQVRVALTTSGVCPNGGTGGHITCPTRWPDDPDAAWEPLLSVGSWEGSMSPSLW
jgi:subtilisin